MVRVIFGLLLVLIPVVAQADQTAPNTDSALGGDVSAPEGESLETLLDEAQDLFISQRPIDARAKLQRALKLAPNDFRPHMMLGAYYLGEVAHFQLAYTYLRKAEELFEKQFGSDKNNTLDPSAWRQHSRLLYLLSEARLNLDKYEASLQTLDRFGARYWDDWYPGTRAWVLMKLKRVDEAIRVAQGGLLRGAEPGRTYNILGILLSLKDNRKLALEAFARAIRSELQMGSLGQVATPLNNSGEVYRELFSDDMAEAAWLKSTGLPDGCDHILPSLNLAILYMDELRLFQADRVLSDFEACFAAHSVRSDTEHRALLALARGRIALRMGDPDKALEFSNSAIERQQWFGKIGTNENDLRFAATIGMSQALSAKAAALGDIETGNIAQSTWDRGLAAWYRVQSWWYGKRAREIALDELDDVEDLYVRHTDAMLEYPTLGDIFAGFPESSFRKRISRLMDSDSREEAKSYYDLYLGTNYLHHGDAAEAARLISKSTKGFRTIDRMVRADALAKLILARRSERGYLSSVFGVSEKEVKEDISAREELFELLPSHVRYHGLALPVAVEIQAEGDAAKDTAESLKEMLTSTRFEELAKPYRESARYVLTVVAKGSPKDKYTLSLSERSSRNLIASVSSDDPLVKKDNAPADSTANAAGNQGADTQSQEPVEPETVVNNFIAKVFSHKVDPPGEPVPPLKLLEGLL